MPVAAAERWLLLIITESGNSTPDTAWPAISSPAIKIRVPHLNFEIVIAKLSPPISS